MYHVENMDPLDFVQERFLNQGAFGKVFEATFQKSGRRVAVKKLAANSNNERSLRREAEILRSADHPHVLAILGVVDNLVQGGEIWIVTELLNGGSLRPYCTGCERLEPNEKIEIGLHCWTALEYLHDVARITHKDIKPENILLHKTIDNRLLAKLCDFGLAKIKNTMMTEETSVVGTFMYYPPEFAESKRNPQKADVYSLGASLCELFTNLHFWHNPTDLKRLEDCQILYKLVVISQNLTVSNPEAIDIDPRYNCGPGGIALGLCTFAQCSSRIRKVLARSVNYDRRIRPAARKMRKAFRKELEALAELTIGQPATVDTSLEASAALLPPSEPSDLPTPSIADLEHRQPTANMEVLNIKGDSRTKGTIRCTFQIPSAVQSDLHPSPGRSYPAACSTLYLPRTKSGRVLTELLKLAFDRRRLFEIGESGCVVWAFRSDLIIDGDHRGIRRFGENLIGNWVYTFKEKLDLERLESALASVGVERSMINL